MKRLLLLLVVAVVLGLAVPAVAAPPVTETVTQQDVTETFVEGSPTCQGGPPLYEITVTYNSVEHSTLFDDGRAHFTFTQTGTFVAEPLDPTAQSATGHFAVWGGFNQNGTVVHNGTFTFNAIGQFEDGTRISVHSVEHFNVTPAGVEFAFLHCHD
jgi:opacity protein-like surface antigen